MLPICLHSTCEHCELAHPSNQHTHAQSHTHSHTRTHTCTQLVDAQRCEDLARLYSLAGRVNAHEALRVAWRDYIKATGLKLVKDEEKVCVCVCVCGCVLYLYTVNAVCVYVCVRVCGMNTLKPLG